MTETTGESPDSQLIERTLAGDEDAYGQLVARYQKRIYRIAFAIVRNESDADAVTQDTFVQGYLHLSRFEGRSELETWLTRITINKARDTLRAPRWLSFGGQQQEGLAVPEPVDGCPDAERQTSSRQLMEAIERAVSRLSPQQRTIFRLRHYEEMPLERITEVMGLRPGTVRAHLFRAVHKIRKDLAGWMPSGYRGEETE